MKIIQVNNKFIYKGIGWRYPPWFVDLKKERNISISFKAPNYMSFKSKFINMYGQYMLFGIPILDKWAKSNQ